MLFRVELQVAKVQLKMLLQILIFSIRNYIINSLISNMDKKLKTLILIKYKKQTIYY
jgi:hypothetical protein